MRCVALTAMVMVSACGESSKRDEVAASEADVAIGGALPEYRAATLAGDSIVLGAHGGSPGSLTLVNVWATWCTSCREEMQDLAAIHRDYGSRGLRVVAVSVDAGSEALVRRFVQREALPFPVVHDQAGTIQKRYRVVGVPTSYLIGADGRVRWRQVGGIHGNLPTVRGEVERALGRDKITRPAGWSVPPLERRDPRYRSSVTQPILFLSATGTDAGTHRERNSGQMAVYHFMDRGFPVIAAIGEYEREEFLAVLERTLVALRHLPAPGMLIDVSQSVALQRRSNADMYSFGMTMIGQRDLFANRLAIIATTDVTFGLMRMGLARATECGLESQVFRDYERALAWLSAAKPPIDVGQSA